MLFNFSNATHSKLHFQQNKNKNGILTNFDLVLPLIVKKEAPELKLCKN